MPQLTTMKIWCLKKRAGKKMTKNLITFLTLFIELK